MKALLLDFMGTIVPDPFYNAAVELGGSLENFSRLKNPDVYLQLERGEINEETYLTHFFRNEAKAIEANFSAYDFKTALLRTPKPYKGAVDLIQEANKQTFTALASNYGPWIHEHLANTDLKYAFHALFVSYRFGVRKPDLAFFKYMAQNIPCEPKDALFVDDQDKNLAGARDAGFVVLKADENWPEEARALLLWG